MNHKQAEAEIKFRILQIIMIILQTEGLVNQDEVEAVRKKAVRKLKPLVGLLE